MPTIFRLAADRWPRTRYGHSKHIGVHDTPETQVISSAYKAIVDPRQTASVMRNRAVRLAVIGYFGHQWELYAMWAWIFAFSRAAFTVNRDASSARDAAFAAAAIISSGAVGC